MGEARSTGNSAVGIQHLSLGLVIDRESVAGLILGDRAVGLERVTEIAVVEATGSVGPTE